MHDFLTLVTVLFSIVFPKIWVNYNDLTTTETHRWWLGFGESSPFMAELFRLVIVIYPEMLDDFGWFWMILDDFRPFNEMIQWMSPSTIPSLGGALRPGRPGVGHRARPSPHGAQDHLAAGTETTWRKGREGGIRAENIGKPLENHRKPLESHRKP